MTQLKLFDDPMPLLDRAHPNGEYGRRPGLMREEWDEAPSCETFEEYLRQKGWPYVAVDEAAGAVFQNDQNDEIDRFDFLVYSQSGPNLLVLLVGEDGPINADVSLLEDWQEVFGPDFQGCLVTLSRGKWLAMTLQEWHGIGWHAQEFDLLL